MSVQGLPRRKPTRLKHYDYSTPGYYYVTICAHNKHCLFGGVIGGVMKLNDRGQMVEAMWRQLPERFGQIELDEFVIMPNHIHGIIVITDHDAKPDVGAPLVGACHHVGADVGAGLVPARRHRQRAGTRPAPTMGDVVGAYKSLTTNCYIRGVREQNWPPFSGKLWQRDYYDRVIRGEKDLSEIRQYIQDNPAKWHEDAENMDREQRPKKRGSADVGAPLVGARRKQRAGTRPAPTSGYKNYVRNETRILPQ